MTAPATKEEITEKIIAVVKTFDGKRNPSVIMQKLGWTKDTVNDMCGLFNVSKFSDILSQIPQIKIEKNEHGTTYVQLVQNTEHTQLNAKQENITIGYQRLKMRSAKVYTKRTKRCALHF